MSAQLRKDLATKSLIVAPGVYDCLTAKLVEQTGFGALYMTGGGVAAALLGYPDYGMPTMTEMADNATRIATAVSVPLIADADTGFGNELNAIRTIREYERGGVAAIHIEDQVFPKRCGHFDGKEVVSREDFLAKIRAAAAGRLNKDTVLIARTDALAVASMDEAVDRMNAALEAGADVAFLEAIESLDQMVEVPRRVKGPCLLNQPPAGTKMPRVTLDQAELMGYRIVILPGLLTRHVFVTCEEVLKDLRETRAYPKSAREPSSLMTIPKYLGSDVLDKWRVQFR